MKAIVHTHTDGTLPCSPLAVSVDCPAKTNLSLHVGARREEWGGRHALNTIYCGVGIYDVVTARRKTAGSGFSLELTGAFLGDLAASDSDMQHNHAVRALFAMAREAGRSTDVALTIDKAIPVAAGLGGGSADAAATMLALNELWDLHWPLERLQAIAATLGADMPFCLSGGYARGTGYGERITILDDDCHALRTLRAKGFSGEMLVGAYMAALSTPAVYAKFDDIGNPDDVPNDLQPAAIALHPRSGHAIGTALRNGATQAFVSGSGPTVIAMCPTPAIRETIEQAWREESCVDRIISAQAPAVPIVHRAG